METFQDQLPPHVFLGAAVMMLGSLKRFQHLIMIYYTRTGSKRTGTGDSNFCL